VSDIPAIVGVAPGRLDVLGGVADYSGGLVLQTPTRATTQVALEPIAADEIVITPESGAAAALPMKEVREAIRRASDDDWAGCRSLLDSCGAPKWARYPVGCIIAAGRAFAWSPGGGLRLTISSTVPQSMGVSSSAALEIATLRALERHANLKFSGTQMAHLGQQAENLIVGAPCGLMDQLAAAFGAPGALLPILCRPDHAGAPVRMPDGVIVVGWPSGVRHSVGASPYSIARAAAFMGRRILQESIGRKIAHLSEVSVTDLGERESNLPEQIRGDAFLRRWDGTDDPLTTVDPHAVYPVLAATRFAIHETARSLMVQARLQGAVADAGALLYESHAAYSEMGLGCDATDAIVDTARRLGPSRGVYGARISGGGSGGTVVVLMEESALPELRAAGRARFGAEPRLIFQAR
jgi:galactokinase